MPTLHSTDNTSVFFRDWGSGDPLVFVHGWGLNSDMWEYQLSALVDAGLRCVAYDRRGCGRSDQPGEGYDFDTLADDLAALMDHLDLRDVTHRPGPLRADRRRVARRSPRVPRRPRARRARDRAGRASRCRTR